MDAFYASVEALDNPELRGKPLIVGGTGGRGVVAAASYEVRKYGVHSAMPMGEALRRCPHAICVPPRFDRYKAVSTAVFGVFHEYTPLVQGLSLDEAFLDVTESKAALGDGAAIAVAIKRKIVERTGVTASVGVAPNKLVAKIASDLRKPDGLVVVAAGDESTFLAPLPISRLWGVGEKTATVLAEYGVKTIGDLAALSPDLLVRRFGKHGASLGTRALGMDDDPVHEGDPAKSVGHETTFDVDSSDPEVIERTLLALSDGVAGRLRSAGVKASTIAVKIRDSSFRTITRQRTLREPTDLTEPIYRAALELARPQVRGIRVRLLGVTASNLGEREQLGLFADADPRRRKAIEAADAVRRRYGSKAVTRGRLVGAGLPAPFERDPRNPLDRRARGLPTENVDADPDAATGRDSLGDTDVDDIPPDDP